MSNALSDPLTYNLDDLIFEEIIEKPIPGQTSKYFSVGIKTRNGTGKPKNLIFGFDRSMSYGLSNTYGITLSVQLCDRDAPTERQRKTVEVINAIVERAKDYLVENRKTLKKPTLSKAQLEGLSPIKVPLNKETGAIDETKSPMLNVKLLTKGRKENEGDAEPTILTRFYSEDEEDENGEPLEVNPLDFLQKRCYVTCAVKIDGIFFGQMQKLQVKLYECNIKAIETKTQRLLASFGEPRPPRPTPKLETEIKDDFADTGDFGDESTSSTLHHSDEENPHEEEKPVPVVASRKKGGKK